jgi:hypothetical protein
VHETNLLRHDRVAIAQPHRSHTSVCSR